MEATERPALADPGLPTVGVLVLVFVSALLRTEGTDWQLVVVAGALAVVTSTAALAAPWKRLPLAALLCLPLAVDAVIGLMRQAQGGSTSGYGSLAILPVVWVGLTLGRAALGTIVAATFALFAVPLLAIGAPLYPDSGWRGAALVTVVCAVVGGGASVAVADQRRLLGIARVRASELDRIVKTQMAIASADFDLADVQSTIVEEARRLTAAEGAVVELPEGEDLVYAAVSGTATPHLGLRLPRAGALSGLALRRLEVLVCDDIERDPRVDRTMARRVGARSMVVVPLAHGEGAVGVLKIFSSAPSAFGKADVQVLEALAGMMGTALVRADLIHTLNEYAARDTLTGLLNRRRWYEELELGMARARRTGTPVSIVVLDVDGLKEVNDAAGHGAGDALLRRFADRWTSVLRTTDLLGRVGGDEFAVLLEATDAETAGHVVTRLARSLDARESASAGVATWDGMETAAQLVARADEQMYEAKRALASGR